MSEKCILYFSGGAMAGVFGAGVASGLCKSGFHDRTRAVYGSSSGALNGAYFVAGQPEGAQIYLECLTKGFIKPLNIPFGVLQRFCHRHLGRFPGQLKQAIDVERAMEIITNDRSLALNIEKVRNSQMPMFVRVWNVKSGSFDYIDLRSCDEPLEVLKSAITAVPYFWLPQADDSDEYIDLALADPLPIDFLANKYPDDKIIAILNFRLCPKKFSVLMRSIRLTEGLVANWCYPEIRPTCFLRGSKKYLESISKAQQNPRVLVIMPPEDAKINAFTTDAAKLKRCYQEGVLASSKIHYGVDG